MLVFEDVEGVIEQEDGAFERVFFTLKQGEFAGVRMTAEFEVCLDPTCECTMLHWIVQPEGKAADKGGYHFAFDIEQRSIATGTEYDEASMRLAEAAFAECSAEDWAELEDIFYSAKAELSDDFDLADVSFQFDDDDDTVYPYGQIFPFAEPFLFVSDKGVEMVAFDSFDAADKTPQVYLTIYQADLPEDQMDEKNAINLIVDYQKKSLTQAADNSLMANPDKMLHSMENAAFDLWSILAKRHQNLRMLYEKGQKA